MLHPNRIRVTVKMKGGYPILREIVSILVEGDADGIRIMVVVFVDHNMAVRR